jgi:hypothetical protein
MKYQEALNTHIVANVLGFATHPYKPQSDTQSNACGWLRNDLVLESRRTSSRTG